MGTHFGCPDNSNSNARPTDTFQSANKPVPAVGTYSLQSRLLVEEVVGSVEMESSAKNLSALEDAGVYVDDLHKLRALDPSNARDSNHLKEECAEFVQQIGDFQKKTDSFIEMSDNVRLHFSWQIVIESISAYSLTLHILKY